MGLKAFCTVIWIVMLIIVGAIKLLEFATWYYGGETK